MKIKTFIIKFHIALISTRRRGREHFCLRHEYELKRPFCACWQTRIGLIERQELCLRSNQASWSLVPNRTVCFLNMICLRSVIRIVDPFENDYAKRRRRILPGNHFQFDFINVSKCIDVEVLRHPFGLQHWRRLKSYNRTNHDWLNSDVGSWKEIRFKECFQDLYLTKD